MNFFLPMLFDITINNWYQCLCLILFCSTKIASLLVDRYFNMDVDGDHDDEDSGIGAAHEINRINSLRGIHSRLSVTICLQRCLLYNS